MATLLAVDDSDQVLYMLRVLLEARGFTVRTATSGRSALQQALESPPDLVLSDILMPEMDGFALCRQWKRNKELQGIPFVFYTATYTDAADRQLAEKLGADGYIHKPAAPDDLVGKLRELIGKRARPQADRPPVDLETETKYFRAYSRTVSRKLGDKMGELEKATRALAEDIGERERAERQAVAAAREKQLLLREMRQRADRDFDLLRRLLDHRDGTPAAVVLTRARRRLKTMAFIEKTLYEAENLEHIDFRHFAPLLLDHLTGQAAAADVRLEIETDLAQVRLLLPQAVCCGQLIGELVHGGIETAAGDGAYLRLHVGLRRGTGGRLEVRYREEGRTAAATDATGSLSLVRAIVGQLGGDLSVLAEHGRTVQVLFDE